MSCKAIIFQNDIDLGNMLGVKECVICHKYRVPKMPERDVCIQCIWEDVKNDM